MLAYITVCTYEYVMDERELKRISLMIGEDQHDAISSKGLNLSWLIRDLIDNFLSGNSINLTVTPETKKLYEKVTGMAGESNAEFEPFLKQALHEFLKIKIQEMQKLEKAAFKK